MNIPYGYLSFPEFMGPSPGFFSCTLWTALKPKACRFTKKKESICKFSHRRRCNQIIFLFRQDYSVCVLLSEWGWSCYDLWIIDRERNLCSIRLSPFHFRDQPISVCLSGCRLCRTRVRQCVQLLHSLALWGHELGLSPWDAHQHLVTSQLVAVG